IAAVVFVVGNAAPRTNTAAESAGELGALSKLALGRGDLADGRILVQHAMREDAVEIEVFIAGLVIALEVLQLPCLAGEPRRNPGFDGVEIGADERMSRLSPQCRA